MSAYRLGARHTQVPATIPHLSTRARLDLIIPAASADWHKAAPSAGDLGNKDFGCCVEAAEFVTIQMRRATVMGDMWKPISDLVLGRYALLTGFDPATGLPDDGTDTRVSMTSWATQGIRINDQDEDVPIWTVLDPVNDLHRRIAIDRTGPVSVTWNLPIAAQDPANWAKAPGSGSDWAPGGWGMHRTPVGKYTPDCFTARSWGLDLDLSPPWWKAFCVAVDATLSREIMGTAGFSMAGLDWDQLEADMRGLSA